MNKYEATVGKHTNDQWVHNRSRGPWAAINLYTAMNPERRDFHRVLDHTDTDHTGSGEWMYYSEPYYTVEALMERFEQDFYGLQRFGWTVEVYDAEHTRWNTPLDNICHIRFIRMDQDQIDRLIELTKNELKEIKDAKKSGEYWDHADMFDDEHLLREKLIVLRRKR